ncbi:MAG: hypothetical protein ACC608_12730 [Anaerofustis sp.]
MFRKTKRKIENMTFLKYVDSDTEACVIQALLDSCGIYSYLDYETDGGNINVIIGNSNLGVNLYVKQEDYDEALALLSSAPDA